MTNPGFQLTQPETRKPINEEQPSSGDEISGHRNSGLSSCPSAVLQKRKGKSKSRTKKQGERCIECTKGFQFWRDPPLQIKCLTCSRWTHLRCIGYVYDEDSFNCQACSPRTPVSEPPASASQPTPQVSVSESPPASVSQSPHPASVSEPPSTSMLRSPPQVSELPPASMPDTGNI